MMSAYRKPGYLQIASYFHFAEPFPPGMVIAGENAEPSDDELANAAEALRSAEIESVREGDALHKTVVDGPGEPHPCLTAADLEAMSIDEVRTVANWLDVPDRSKITEKADLIAEILRRL